MMVNFLNEMRLTGRIYNTESYHLTVIDRDSLNADIAPDTLPRDFVENWAAKREHESTKTWANRTVVIRKLGMGIGTQNKTDRPRTDLL